MQKVLILGGTGMLGHACREILEESNGLEVLSTARNQVPGYVNFDARVDDAKTLIEDLNPDWIINCIGIIKPHIDEKSVESIAQAVAINSVFPEKLANSTSKPIIQIATDCVYSGATGSYSELDLHDATDVYGKSKSLGEVPAENVMHIRASIIGPEVGRSTSLLEWFLNQPEGTTLNGFTNHLWNGVTTHHFGKIAAGLIANNFTSFQKAHAIPGNVLSKSDLLRSFASIYNRNDLTINDVLSNLEINRTLSTNNPDLNLKIWEMAGYSTPPTVEEMVAEQAARRKG